MNPKPIRFAEMLPTILRSLFNPRELHPRYNAELLEFAEVMTHVPDHLADDIRPARLYVCADSNVNSVELQAVSEVGEARELSRMLGELLYREHFPEAEMDLAQSCFRRLDADIAQLGFDIAVCDNASALGWWVLRGITRENIEQQFEQLPDFLTIFLDSKAIQTDSLAWGRNWTAGHFRVRAALSGADTLERIKEAVDLVAAMGVPHDDFFFLETFVPLMTEPDLRIDLEMHFTESECLHLALIAHNPSKSLFFTYLEMADLGAAFDRVAAFEGSLQVDMTHAIELSRRWVRFYYTPPVEMRGL